MYFGTSEEFYGFRHTTDFITPLLGWRRRLLGFALSLMRTHRPFGQLVKVRAVLSANKGDLDS